LTTAPLDIDGEAGAVDFLYRSVMSQQCALL